MLESSAPMGASAAAARAAGAPPTTGLRERKKQQTRLRIIAAALDLCDTQGFDATTIEQIAHVADVSPRTINRYFDNKEDIVLGPVKDFGRTIAETLRELPRTGNELEALRTAFLHVVDRAAAAGDADPLSFRQFQQIQRILRSSPSVSARSMEHADDKNTAIAAVVAERLGTTPDARPVRLIVGTWQLIGHIGMECSDDTFLDEDLSAAARAGRAAFTETYDEFVRACCGAPGAADQ
ncbi:TetR family transcriptional regulator [Nocardia beijingensis]|uniref:TetR/AcrR family transcriptional regulator n=1 Tax=Nocardia beijingensis TaxID=95162 RepID=UPI00189514D0|nr:TetR family transcriptional regulator [Nocardia beijingensis]MBF6465078.1 TetR family transcriptional regulator [Nocardia beijingensis]